MTGTSPDDPDDAEGPEPTSLRQGFCLQGKTPKVSRGGWSPLKTRWGSSVTGGSSQGGGAGGSVGTVLILEPVGGYEGVPHTVRIKNSYGFSFIFQKD